MAVKAKNFDELKLNKQILNAIEELGFQQPTEIQAKAIPLAIDGHDLLGIAQTGTGKTLAFVTPLIMKLKYAQGQDPRALVLAPTRELIIQIHEHFIKLAKYTDLRIQAIYGGLGPKQQIALLEEGVDVIISTPGRFLDLYKKGAFFPREIKTMVLDEADKMMDMGFMPQIRNILEIVPVKRQNLLFSATMPENVVQLTHEFLEFPERVEATPQASVTDTIAQRLYEVPNYKTKLNLLKHFLQDDAFKRVIVFVKTKTSANDIGKFLERKAEGGVRVIHANKGQNSRMNAIREFSEGAVRVLVSTDVTSRGMDISMVSHVINFDLPIVYEDYVHRIGRTGRAKQEGVAITFANEWEMVHIPRIEKIIQEKIKVSAIPKEVMIEKTPFDEQQNMARALDNMRKKADPDFQGAFHEKKKKPLKSSSKRNAKQKRKKR